MAFEILTSLKGRIFGLDKDGYWGGLKGERDNVTTGSTSANIENFGVTQIGSTSAAKAYTLDAPVEGVRKVLSAVAGSTGTLATVTCASGTTLDGTNTIATFNASGDVLTLFGLSSTRWTVAGNVGSVALSTS